MLENGADINIGFQALEKLFLVNFKKVQKTKRYWYYLKRLTAKVATLALNYFA